MKNKSVVQNYLVVCIVTFLGVQQLHASDFKITNTHIFGTTAILSAFAYAAYLHANKITPEPIPNATTTNKKAIIFDLDGVLATTNKLQAFHEIGIPTTLLYMQDQMQLPSEKILFDTLANVPAVSTYASYNKDLRMPQIMIDWQIGAQDLPTIRQSIIDYLTTATLPKSRKNWALQTAMMMMNPQQFVATRQTIPANVALVHELKDKGYNVYILSNWDATSFPLFQAKFPELFIHKGKPTFDGIMISGDVGIVKPEIGIFKECLKKFKLKAENAIFIDDEPANVQGAQKTGLTTVLCDPTDTQAVHDDLVVAIK